MLGEGRKKASIHERRKSRRNRSSCSYAKGGFDSRQPLLVPGVVGCTNDSNTGRIQSGLGLRGPPETNESLRLTEERSGERGMVLPKGLLRSLPQGPEDGQNS